MANEGLISRQEAVARIDPASLDQLLHPTLDPKAERKIVADRPAGLARRGLAARSCSRPTRPRALKAAGHKVILVRVETTPEDIHGMHAAEGILTTRGGMTTHAAVVARGMGKPCVSGAGTIRVDYAAQTMIAIGARRFKKGDIITIDGSTGEVMDGAVAMLAAGALGRFRHADGLGRRSAPHEGARQRRDAADARVARQFGAEGIGLCRTEHMFFDADRIVAVREMILADDEAGRRAALAKILPMQRGDFAELFEIMEGLPVTIRLLDPPLHEFLPHTDEEIAEVAERDGRGPRTSSSGAPPNCTNSTRCSASAAAVWASPIRKSTKCRRARSSRPRSKPEDDRARPVTPEIMIPLVMTKARTRSDQGAHRSPWREPVAKETGVTIPYQVGTMIELPRAALRAGEIAETAEFFSFGTNDLTQTTLGISRDDAGSFLGAYIAEGHSAAAIRSSRSTRRASAN